MMESSSSSTQSTTSTTTTTNKELNGSTSSLSSSTTSLTNNDEKKFDPFKNLTEKQMEAYREIRELFSDLTDPQDIAYCTDMCFLRYLRARNYIVPKSEKMLRDSLEWRKKYKPNEICLRDVKEIAATGCIYVNGKKDKKGRPIIIARPRNDTLKDVPGADKFKNLVYWLESGFRGMNEDKGIETFCFIVDYNDFSRKNLDMKTNLESMHLLLDHCPERMGQSLFLDPPTLFWIAWKIISPFLNEVTLSKVKFIYSKKVNGKRVFPELLDYIDADQLESDLGGTFDYQFNLEDHLKLHPDPIIVNNNENENQDTNSNGTTTTTASSANPDTKDKKDKKKDKKEKEKKEKKDKKKDKKEKDIQAELEKEID
eukprot:gene10109-12398_t